MENKPERRVVAELCLMTDVILSQRKRLSNQRGQYGIIFKMRVLSKNKPTLTSIVACPIAAEMMTTGMRSLFPVLGPPRA